MSVLLSAGGPSERSRTVALLEATGQRLQTRGLRVKRLRVRDLNPQGLASGRERIQIFKCVGATAPVLSFPVKRNSTGLCVTVAALDAAGTHESLSLRFTNKKGLGVSLLRGP